MFRTVSVGFLCLLLTLSLFGANLAIGVDRGPLDRDRMTTAAADADLYPAIHEAVVDRLSEELADRETGDLPVSPDPIIADTVTPDWIRGETERNLNNVYDYLEGDAELEVYFDMRPLEENAADAIATELEQVDYANVGFEPLDALLESPESYERERAALRTDLLRSLDVDPNSGFGNPTLEAMIENESSYERQRAAARTDIAEGVLAELEPSSGFGVPRLERMLESEAAYTNEQETFRENRKQEIQEETDRELSEEELEWAYQEKRDEIIEEATAEALEQVNRTEAPPVFAPHAEEIAALTAEALATDLSYTTFEARYDDRVAALETDVHEAAQEDTEQFAPQVRAHVEAELDTADVPEPVETELTPVVNLTVEAVTTDLSHDSFVRRYDDIAADVETAMTAHIWEQRDEYEDEIEAGVVAEMDDEEVPEPLAAEMDAAVDLGLKAVLTDMEYATFVEEFRTIEEDMSTSLAASLFDVEEGVPERIEVTDRLTAEAGAELALLRTAGEVIGLLVLVLPALSIGFLAGIYLVARDVGTTALALGVASLLGGGSSYAIATRVPAAINAEISRTDVSTELAAAIQEVVGAAFAPLAGQSTLLLVGGVGLTATGVAIRLDLLELVRARR